MTSRHPIHVVFFSIALATLPIACTLFAPSDQELMGGLAKDEAEGGADGGDGSARDAQSDTSIQPVCDAGGNGASCTTDNQCCSGKCRGNGLCL